MADHQPPELTWRDDYIPISRAFDDPYFSLQNGLAETRHVFIGGNALQARLMNGFHIAELGFGTGLNMLAVLDLWRSTGRKGRIYYTSFELAPLAAADMIRAQAAFNELQMVAAECAPHWGKSHIDLPDFELNVIIGDIRETLPHWGGQADAWFLDGFSPAKNPQMWQADVLAGIGQHTHAGGTFATYSAAGHVRANLQAAGFDVQRVQGFGKKRHMSIGQKP